MAFIPRIFRPGPEHFFLLGPRGTGKTLWSTHQYPKALRIDLLEPETLRQLSARPERLIELVEGNAAKPQVIIDEVQKLPALLEVVHLLIERKTGQQFILTGSSARTLRRHGVNLLGGRAAQKHLYPYLAVELGKRFNRHGVNLLGGRAAQKHLYPDLAVELGKRFNLGAALRHGMLPLVWAAAEPDSILKAYNGLYLREEVQMEGLVRNVGSFARFMEAMSFSHASVLNLSNVSRDCQVSRKTVEGYLEILEDLLLGFRLRVFSKRAKRELATHPKFYFFDAGVFRANRPSGPLDAPQEIDGLALEGLVAQHLRAWCDYSAGNHSLYYWQTRSQVEVDFVVYGETGVFAVEVKNSRQVRPDDLRSLKHFAEDYPQSHRFLLHRGEDRFKRDGVSCVPCEDFLLGLRPNRFQT